MPSKDPTNAVRQERYRHLKEQQGLKRIQVWVPVSRVDDLKSIADSFIQAHQRNRHNAK
jgi:hypothetical protein